MRLFRRSATPAIGAHHLDDAVRDGAVVVDVRTREEWRAGHLPFARHIPLDDLGARVSELDPAMLTVFVCRSGSRSEAAADALAGHGFNVANLSGGMVACRRAGVPVVRDDGRTGVVA